MEYKKLLLSVLGLFTLSHVLSAFAEGYYTLMLSRIGVACSHAIFWSIATPVAVRIAPNGHRSTALSLIVSGTSIAMIVGLPLGRIIGLYVGWRMTFFWIAVIALVVFLIMWGIFPKVPVRSSVSLKSLPSLLKSPGLMGVYLMTAIIVTGHYTAYSYIEPFLGQAAQLSPDMVTMLLTAFGVVGIVGSLLFSQYYDKRPNAFIRLATAGLAAFLLLLHAASFSEYSMILACLLWGLAINSYNLVFNAKIIQLAPEGTAVAMSIYSGIYNVGIGAGALIGGAACTYASVSYVGYVGGIVALVGSVYCMKKLLPIFRQHDLTTKSEKI